MNSSCSHNEGTCLDFQSYRWRFKYRKLMELWSGGETWNIRNGSAPCDMSCRIKFGNIIRQISFANTKARHFTRTNSCITFILILSSLFSIYSFQRSFAIGILSLFRIFSPDTQVLPQQTLLFCLPQKYQDYEYKSKLKK